MEKESSARLLTRLMFRLPLGKAVTGAGLATGTGFLGKRLYDREKVNAADATRTVNAPASDYLTTDAQRQAATNWLQRNYLSRTIAPGRTTEYRFPRWQDSDAYRAQLPVLMQLFRDNKQWWER